MTAKQSQSQIDESLSFTQMTLDLAETWMTELFTANIFFSSQNAQAWNIKKECEVYGAELYTIQQALQQLSFQ